MKINYIKYHIILAISLHILFISLVFSKVILDLPIYDNISTVSYLIVVGCLYAISNAWTETYLGMIGYDYNNLLVKSTFLIQKIFEIIVIIYAVIIFI